MLARLFALVVASLALAACAMRGDVRQLQQQIATLNSAFGTIQAQQISGTADDSLRDEVKTAQAQLLGLETRLADAAVEIGRLESRLTAVERDAHEMSVKIQALQAMVAKLEAPPPAAAPPPVASEPPRTPEVTPPPPQTSTPVPVPSGRPASGAQQLYDVALANFRAREHGQAVVEFLDFLQRYPDHRLAANAQYWIGEAYFAQRDYRQAAVEFEKVLAYDASHPKVSDALLREAMAYRELHDGTRAAEILRRVVRDHPKSGAAVRARELLRGSASRAAHR